MWIVFIGPPGAGKGTQGKRLAEYLGIPHFSTGEMLREAMSRDSALARWIASYIDQGRLAPDHMVMRIVAQRLHSEDCASGALFDGFPRTAIQAQLLDDFLAEQAQHVDLAFELRADEGRLIERLLLRSATEGRIDDKHQTIGERMKVYRLQTAPVIDYYSRQKKLAVIDALQPPDAVFASICSQVDHYSSR